MNLHEYQAKRLLSERGIPVPKGFVAKNVEEAIAASKKLTTDKWVVKAQIHAGGRGKAGGVKIVADEQELQSVARDLLHKKLHTYQTGSDGQPVNALLIEETSEIKTELYLGAVVDRSTRKIVFMASTEGGVEIEKVAEQTPEKILKITVDPLLGVMGYQCRELAFGLGLEGKQIRQFTDIVIHLGKMFKGLDFSLLEINPLIVNQDGDLICLDCKINIDDNALYRQEKMSSLRDPAQEDARELKAKEWELNYISLDGSIGCMVNGAGLAMATMDLIKLSGGFPANFLDVGGGATKERVAEAFKIILSDNKVKSVLINIFGGIVRCDLIAEGIVSAINEVGIQVPVIVRLEGNKSTEAREILSKSDLNIIAAESLADAATQAVTAAGDRA